MDKKQPAKDQPTVSTAVHIAAQQANEALLGNTPLPQADADFRNQCAIIAYTEIVRSFIAQNKAGQEGLAASWAFRFADAMLDRSKIEPKKSASVQVRGKAEVPQEEPPSFGNLTDEPVPPIAADAPGLIQA